MAKSRDDGAERGPQIVEEAANRGELVIAGRRYRLVPVDDEGEVADGKPKSTTRLTERELQIAGLVAQGLVNKQIAEELHISEWTVSTHLRRIFGKLGVDTRAAMVCKCADVLPRRP